MNFILIRLYRRQAHATSGRRLLNFSLSVFPATVLRKLALEAAVSGSRDTGRRQRERRPPVRGAWQPGLALELGRPSILRSAFGEKLDQWCGL